jgi:hypothetical protein
MSNLRIALLCVLSILAIGLVLGGRALFRVRRNRMQIEARQREAAFLRNNTPRKPPA